uniref:Kunitz-like protease inhibitor n=1 Tax=Amblyomma variegatum TaxID=34610 RepID=F0J9T0_AMBVA|nr:TPA_inf: Kunitz-like protease inhibitor precursor [Amblyomma variegatum]
MHIHLFVLLTACGLTFTYDAGEERPMVCYLQPEEGRCNNQPPNVPRWYFDPRYGYCGPFEWGGCAGNANNFPNCTQCMSVCTDHPQPRQICRDALHAD